MLIFIGIEKPTEQKLP